MKRIEIELSDGVAAELDYLVELHNKHGAPNPCETVSELLATVAVAIADGSRRPGAWERQILEMAGLVPDTEEAYQYRATYGRPDGG